MFSDIRKSFIRIDKCSMRRFKNQLTLADANGTENFVKKMC